MFIVVSVCDVLVSSVRVVLQYTITGGYSPRPDLFSLAQQTQTVNKLLCSLVQLVAVTCALW